MIWELSNDKQNATKSQTITTKLGPISQVSQDKSGIFYVVGHCSTLTDKKANITIWQLD